MNNEPITQATPQVSTQPTRKNWRILKLIFFFLLGGAGFLTFIIGALWIKFKSKVNRISKFIALVVGLALF
jgi:hypothetical protein